MPKNEDVALLPNTNQGKLKHENKLNSVRQKSQPKVVDVYTEAPDNLTHNMSSSNTASSTDNNSQSTTIYTTSSESPATSQIASSIGENKPWRRILYEDQDYPDHHIPDSFMSCLQTNQGVDIDGFINLITSSLPIGERIASTTLWFAIYSILLHTNSDISTTNTNTVIESFANSSISSKLISHFNPIAGIVEWLSNVELTQWVPVTEYINQFSEISSQITTPLYSRSFIYSFSSAIYLYLPTPVMENFSKFCYSMSYFIIEKLFHLYSIVSFDNSIFSIPSVSFITCLTLLFLTISSLSFLTTLQFPCVKKSICLSSYQEHRSEKEGSESVAVDYDPTDLSEWLLESEDFWTTVSTMISRTAIFLAISIIISPITHYLGFIPDSKCYALVSISLLIHMVLHDYLPLSFKRVYTIQKNDDNYDSPNSVNNTLKPISTSSTPAISRTSSSNSEINGGVQRNITPSYIVTTGKDKSVPVDSNGDKPKNSTTEKVSIGKKVKKVLLVISATIIDDPNQLFSHESTNAAVFASILLASRINHIYDILSFLTFSIVFYSVLPVTTSLLRVRVPFLYNIYTILLIFVTWFFIFSQSPILGVVYEIGIVVVTVISPICLYQISQKKLVYHGPWDYFEEGEVGTENI